MKIEDAELLFNSPILAVRCERDTDGERKMVWTVRPCEAYYTSDTDRLVGLDRGRDFSEGYGPTLGEALDDLAAKIRAGRAADVAFSRESLGKASDALADFDARLAALPTAVVPQTR